jgi:hypothetical protein
MIDIFCPLASYIHNTKERRTKFIYHKYVPSERKTFPFPSSQFSIITIGNSGNARLLIRRLGSSPWSHPRLFRSDNGFRRKRYNWLRGNDYGRGDDRVAAAQSPAEEGTALTSLPMGTRLVPQLAA